MPLIELIIAAFVLADHPCKPCSPSLRLSVEPRLGTAEGEEELLWWAELPGWISRNKALVGEAGLEPAASCA